MYLEHFSLLIPAEWSAVFSTSSHSEALKKILMIFLIRYQAAWLFHLTRYWCPQRRFPVKSSVPKDAAESLNIFEKLLVLVNCRPTAWTKIISFSWFSFSVLIPDLEILSDLWSFVAVVDRWKSLSILAKAFIF